MAMLQDQNINIHFDGASLFGKNDTSKALKKGGGLGGRKALNDISNSAKPSSLQASKKNSTSVISIGKDLNVTKNKFIAGTKDNLAKVPDRGGRKALTDLTNSSKPSAKQGSKKGLDKKLSAAAAANIPTSIAEEQFQLETPVKKHFEVDEMPELLMCDQAPQCDTMGTCGDSSPISPKLSYMSWKDVSDPCFTLTGTPDRQKY